MNHLLRKCAGLFLVLMLPLGFSSCLQYEQSSMFFSDGSGKISFSIGMKKSTIEQLKSMAESMGSEEDVDPLSDFSDPEKLSKNSEGIVAWTTPKTVEDGKWIRVLYTGYFDDINKVRIYQEEEESEERSLSFACRYEKGEETSVLTLIDDTREKLTEDLDSSEEEENSAEREMQIQMMKTMMEGLKIKMSITLPGEIQESTGFMLSEGRTCSIEMDDKLMIEVMEDPDGEAAKKLESMSGGKAPKVVFKNEEASGESISSFRKEMAKVKASWEKLQKEMKEELEEEE